MSPACRKPSGTTTLNGGGSTVVLDSAGNTFTDAISVSNASGLTLVDTTALDLQALTLTGNLSVTAVGITDSGTLSIGGTTTRADDTLATALAQVSKSQIEAFNRADVEAYLRCFDTGVAPAVGVQHGVAGAVQDRDLAVHLGEDLRDRRDAELAERLRHGREGRDERGGLGEAVEADDRDVVRYLKFFTFLGRDEIDALAAQHAADPGKRVAHRALAAAVTDLMMREPKREG